MNEAAAARGHKFSVDAMQAAFSRVQDPEDWRAPIKATVETWNFEDIELVLDAIRFYTATEPIWFAHGRGENGYRFQITADGYRAGPAGP
jgi:hypothetical protein